MTTSYLYLEIHHLNGSNTSLKLVDNGTNAYKVCSLEEGRPTTFDIPKESPLYVKPISVYDTLKEQTLTLYPSSFISMTVKEVESETP